MAGHTHTHAHDDHHEEHGLAHVASKKTLLGVGGILLFLTLVTVAATKVDFGSQLNLLVAMAIATVKATLVAMFFMHLRYDKPFHTVVVAGALLAAILFVGFAFLDGNQYQRDVCKDRRPSCEIWGDAIAAHKKAAVTAADPKQAGPAGEAQPTPTPPGRPATAPGAAPEPAADDDTQPAADGDTQPAPEPEPEAPAQPAPEPEPEAPQP